MRSAFKIGLLSLLLISGPASAAEKAAESKSDKPEIKVENLGVLQLNKANKGDGYVAQFSPIQIKTRYCSGACSGTSVGSWTCPDSMNCYLDCTSNPPHGGCY